MIPKKIHYVWFGGNPLPHLGKKCLRSWKKYCPDYEIILWNEKNFDISSCPLYVRQAYEMKKWAFVSDYARLKVIYENGGIYLDTDVEIIKNIDFLLEHEAFFAIESDGITVASGLGFGAEKGNPAVKTMMDDYEGQAFIKEDGGFDLTPCPVRNTRSLYKYGFEKENKDQLLPGNIRILPSEYMCPMFYSTGILTMTDKTVSIHHYSSSWINGWVRFRVKITRKLRRTFGEHCLDFLKRKKK